MDCFQIGKGVGQGCILSPCLFNLYAEYITRNARVDEAQTEIKIAKRDINNLRYADDTTLMVESEEELKSLLMKVKEREKAGLKLNIKKTKILASSLITLWPIEGENGSSDWFYILGLQNHCGWWLQPWSLKSLAPWKKSYDKPRQCHHFANKDLCGQSYGFSSSHVRMWELDHKEGWTSKNWCFWIVVLEKTLESPLDCKEIKPVNPKGNQPWIFIGRTDAEAEAPTLWPPDVKRRLIGKDPDAGSKAKGEGGWRGWDGWMILSTQWS